MFAHGLRLATGLTILVIAGTAANADDLTIDWYTIDGGGAMFTTGADFELSGTIGQPDAHPVVLTGGDYELAGGFWGASAGEPDPIPGDIDGNGDVDLSDLAALLASYEACEGDPTFDPDADLDGSGCVDLSDLAELLAHYGEGT